MHLLGVALPQQVCVWTSLGPFVKPDLQLLVTKALQFRSRSMHPSWIRAAQLIPHVVAREVRGLGW